MAITAIERITYAVKDLGEARRFFVDFGLMPVDGDDGCATFELADASRVILRSAGDPALPRSSAVQGDGVHEVIWGLDSEEALRDLVAALRADLPVEGGKDGVFRFVPPFGVPMGLKVFRRRPVVCAPDPLNAPGHVGRLNQHRKWRRNARPKAISHVVFAVPAFEAACRFMMERLNFRLSDRQKGFGAYLRADGTANHHSIAFSDADAPLPGMDGTLRFHHANFALEDIDEIMVGANHMARQGWKPSELGLGRHRVDSALFYYLDCPAGGEAEYGADADYVDDGWIPREFDPPLFGYAHFVHNLPPFLREEPVWAFRYLTDTKVSRGPL